MGFFVWKDGDKMMSEKNTRMIIKQKTAFYKKCGENFIKP